MLNSFIIIVVCLVVGSFLNLVIHRLPIILKRKWHEESLEYLGEELEEELVSERYDLAFPPSHCPICHTSLRFWHMIPLVSYLFLKGRCGHCEARISIRYFFVELLSVVLGLVAGLEFGFSIPLLTVLLFNWILITITFIDIEHQLLPDILTLLLLWAGLVVNCFDLFASSHDAILGAVFGYGFFWAIGGLFKLIRKTEGIGQGDFKLLAAIGAWVGWQVLPFVIFTSSVVGLVIGGMFLALKKAPRNTPIPFGPFIAIAGFVGLIWGFDATEYYLNFIGASWSSV